MACCKRNCAPATFTITLFVVIASLYLSSSYTTLMLRDTGGLSPLTQHYQDDMQILERSSEEVEKQMLFVQNKAKQQMKSHVQNVTHPEKVAQHAVEKNEWLKMVESERQNIMEEMKQYKFHLRNVTLSSLIPERGGHPVRAVVRT